MRQKYLDHAKGLAIFLVIWMHCIQYLHKESFENSIYAIVYTFHMPLFLIISGYLFYSSLTRPSMTVIKNKSLRLIVPNVLWGGILALLLGDYSPSVVFTSFWFLNTLFIGLCLYLLINKFIGIPYSILVLSLGVLLLPGLQFIKFSIPFIGIGLWIKKLNIIDKIKDAPLVLVAMMLIILFFYINVWDKSWYIYITSAPKFFNSDIHAWIAYFARIFYGSITSLFILAMLKLFEDKCGRVVDKLLCALSSNSLGLYVMHMFILILISDYVSIFLEDISSTSLQNTLISFCISGLFTYLILQMVNLFKRHSILKYLC